MMEVMVKTGAIGRAKLQSSPPTNKHQVFYRPDALPVAQPTVSKHWRENNIPWTCLPQAHLGSSNFIFDHLQTPITLSWKNMASTVPVLVQPPMWSLCSLLIA